MRLLNFLIRLVSWKRGSGLADTYAAAFSASAIQGGNNRDVWTYGPREGVRAVTELARAISEAANVNKKDFRR